METMTAPAGSGNRRPLPDRRPHISFDLEHLGVWYRVGIGYWPDGAPGELFLSTAKDGSGLDVSVCDASIAVSLALQHGTPLDTIAKALCRDPRGQPSGVVGVMLDRLLQEGAEV
jgi:hypothetical protein